MLQSVHMDAFIRARVRGEDSETRATSRAETPRQAPPAEAAAADMCCPVPPFVLLMHCCTAALRP